MNPCPICNHPHLHGEVCAEPLLIHWQVSQPPVCRCTGTGIWRTFRFATEATARDIATQLQRAGFSLYVFTTDETRHDHVARLVDESFICSVYTGDPQRLASPATVKDWMAQVEGVVNVMQRSGRLSQDDIAAAEQQFGGRYAKTETLR